MAAPIKFCGKKEISNELKEKIKKENRINVGYRPGIIVSELFAWNPDDDGARPNGHCRFKNGAWMRLYPWITHGWRRPAGQRIAWMGAFLSFPWKALWSKQTNCNCRKSHSAPKGFNLACKPSSYLGEPSCPRRNQLLAKMNNHIELGTIYHLCSMDLTFLFYGKTGCGTE